MTSPKLQPFDLGRAPQGWWVGNSQLVCPRGFG